MDDFNTLSNRLLNRCPAVGIQLANQLINDSFRIFQSRREWSFRRRSGTFAPPPLYTVGTLSTNVATGNPNLLTGVGTTWTPQMVGQQIRPVGLLYPYYTIQNFLSPTEILIDQPWAGPDVTNVTYQILQVYYGVPADFGYWYVVISLSGAYRLWINITENELAVYDPQRTNQGVPIGVAFKDYTQNFGGTIGPVIPITSPADPTPVSTTTFGFSYVSNASYVIQVVSPGISGTATFKWLRAGQTAFQPTVTTSDQPQDLQDGVQVYWPDGVSYVAGDLFVINAQSQITTGVPRYEIWPAPSFNTSLSSGLLPYIYIAKEYDLTVQQPQLPPFVANRGEVILEMALAACARYPGADIDHPNPYFNLALSQIHDARCEVLINDMERNDEEVGLTRISYEQLEQILAPWNDSSWQQVHAPYLVG